MIDEKKLIKKLKQYNSKNIVAIGIVDIISILNEQPKVGEWIPCSERLPKEPDEQYIITNKYGEVDVATYDGLCYWDEYNPDEVIAWMLLPASYKEERGGKNG